METRENGYIAYNVNPKNGRLRGLGSHASLGCGLHYLLEGTNVTTCCHDGIWRPPLGYSFFNYSISVFVHSVGIILCFSLLNFYFIQKVVYVNHGKIVLCDVWAAAKSKILERSILISFNFRYLQIGSKN